MFRKITMKYNTLPNRMYHFRFLQYFQVRMLSTERWHHCHYLHMWNMSQGKILQSGLSCEVLCSSWPFNLKKSLSIQQWNFYKMLNSKTLGKFIKKLTFNWLYEGTNFSQGLVISLLLISRFLGPQIMAAEISLYWK